MICRINLILRNRVGSHLLSSFNKENWLTAFTKCACGVGDFSESKSSALSTLRGIRDSMSNVVKLKEGNSLQSHVVAAASALKAGHVIGVPTDTIYGVAALAQDSTAVEHIYHIKHRSDSKPLAICVGEVHDVYTWGLVTVPHSLLTSLFPGPVTLLFHRTQALNSALNPGTELVGIRIPDHTFIRGLARVCQEPLALTSANLSSKPSALTVAEFEELWPSLHTVYDGGKLGEANECRTGSTIVDLSQPGSYRIIRRGIAFSQTVELLHQYGLILID
ncbi:threonyl-carbamoyl synthesis 1 [Oratosquilla oratoria]|uniref:threonyl-carbamoyl synthesis 1 n=1 Tax=Oratosquilla oratoria TaxID=337810 RepID=UPI003F7722F8